MISLFTLQIKLAEKGWILHMIHCSKLKPPSPFFVSDFFLLFRSCIKSLRLNLDVNKHVFQQFWFVNKNLASFFFFCPFLPCNSFLISDKKEMLWHIYTKTSKILTHSSCLNVCKQNQGSQEREQHWKYVQKDSV